MNIKKACEQYFHYVNTLKIFQTKIKYFKIVTLHGVTRQDGKVDNVL